LAYHQTTTITMPPRKPVPWINSKAKHMLREDILAGRVLDGMDPKVVYESRPEFQKFPYDRFRPNLKSLHERIRKDRDRMEEDCEAYHADMSLLLALRDDDDAPEYSAPDVLPWHMSEAKALLAQDISDGKNEEMTPKELYATRGEYQVYSLTKFRKHIYQEVDAEEKHRWRSEKKKLRAAMTLNMKR
jgi:hypothetical protein